MNDRISTECSCETCVKMCEYKPCWNTPESALILMEEGYGPLLMLDYWCADPDIYILSAPIKGYEASLAPHTPTGKCALLKNNSLCEIHNLKPTEGKLAICKPSKGNLHEEIVKSWDNDDARALIELWKEEFLIDEY